MSELSKRSDREGLFSILVLHLSNCPLQVARHVSYPHFRHRLSFLFPVFFSMKSCQADQADPSPEMLVSFGRLLPAGCFVSCASLYPDLLPSVRAASSGVLAHGSDLCRDLCRPSHDPYA